MFRFRAGGVPPHSNSARNFGGVLIAAATTAALAAASPASAIVLTDPIAPDATFAPAASLPPGCSDHDKTPDVRQRTANRDTYLHEMSAACYPNGPVDGTVPNQSTFRLYWQDTQGTHHNDAYCYGYSVNLGKLGFILCDAIPS